jgi:nucleotide-binding universal stress UspA family protein
MPAIKKILCAVDFSDQSSKVADYAKTMGEALGAKISVLYVAPSLSQYVGFHIPASTIENFVGEIVTGADSTMTAFMDENFQGVDADGKVVAGYAAEEILEFAKKEDMDMVIMGTHGRHGIDRILFGSVAEKVVKTCRCPVLTVRPD